MNPIAINTSKARVRLVNLSFHILLLNKRDDCIFTEIYAASTVYLVRIENPIADQGARADLILCT